MTCMYMHLYIPCQMHTNCDKSNRDKRDLKVLRFLASTTFAGICNSLQDPTTGE